MATRVEVERELYEMFESAIDYQQRALSKILKDNADCEYFEKHGFYLSGDVCFDRSQFKVCIPLGDYPDIEEYIQRIADDGESPSILCNYPLVNFSISSGTTAGNPKKFICSSEFVRLINKSCLFISTVIGRVKEDALINGDITMKEPKIMSFEVVGKQFMTKTGYKVGTATTNVYRGDVFIKRYKTMGYCSPIEVMFCGNSQHGLYCHLLSGLLKPSDVWCFDSGFSFIMDAAINVLCSKWQNLCKDIRTGTLDAEIKDANLREAMQTLLKPDPELANSIERECSKSEWRGILRRLWPNALFIQCRASGPTMKRYLQSINYFSDNLPIYGISYGASEGGILAICLNVLKSPDKDFQFTFLPNVAFYEFIPLQRVQSQDNGIEQLGSNDFSYACKNGAVETVELDQVQVGMYYQPVITNHQGLYRYKLPDIIKISSFVGQSPTCEFVCRNYAILGVSGDKTDEAELELLLEKVFKFLAKHEISLIEYTSTVNVTCNPGHYVIFVEIMEHGNIQDMGKIMEESCYMLDSSFNCIYKMLRKSGSIGPLKVCVVENGTFQKVMEERLSKGASLSQYKPPRSILWDSPSRNYLSNATLKTYTSSISLGDVKI